jgi:hypothetical protein
MTYNNTLLILSCAERELRKNTFGLGLRGLVSSFEFSLAGAALALRALATQAGTAGLPLGPGDCPTSCP